MILKQSKTQSYYEKIRYVGETWEDAKQRILNKRIMGKVIK